MKIKSVCETFGLSEGTVRYYIEQKLISPSYTENYLGCKIFDFSSDDVESLKNVAMLRRFGFSPDEIRELKNHPEKSPAIIAEVRSRKERHVVESQAMRVMLYSLGDGKEYTVDGLAQKLSDFTFSGEQATETYQRNFDSTMAVRYVLSFLVVWLPIVLSGMTVGFDFVSRIDPRLDISAVFLTAVSFLPSVLTLILSVCGVNLAKINKLLRVFCVLSIPLSCAISAGVVI